MPKSSGEPALVAEPVAPWLRVARIVRPQGHRGEVIAELLTDFPERFKAQAAVSLRAARADAPDVIMTIERFRLHQGRIVFKFVGCETMTDAETLRGLDVVIAWSERMPLASDEVYIAELAGCVLIDARTGERVGRVADVDRESSNTALLVVERDGGGELLVPFVKAYAPRWDLAARTLHMEMPAGLLELADPENPAEPGGPEPTE